MANAALTMDDLLAGDSVKQLVAGEIIVGTVLSLRKHEVLIDLGAQGVGVVPRREVGFSRSLAIGEEVTASVVDAELDSGLSLLSLRKAAKDRGWDELQRVHEANDIVEIVPYDANRGGLLVEMEGIRGFLPVSQLAAGCLQLWHGIFKCHIVKSGVKKLYFFTFENILPRDRD